jgi:GGDEF domain-containing protein
VPQRCRHGSHDRTRGGTLAVPGDTPETLLHRADTATYAATRDGEDSVELFAQLGAPAAV